MVDHDSDLENISDENGTDSDDDFTETEQLESGIITGVFDVDPYLSCPNRRCNNSKLQTIEENGKYMMTCKSCKVIFGASAANQYLRCLVLFETKSATAKVAMFLPEIKKIFVSRGVVFKMSFDKADLLLQMFNVVPIEARCKVVSNTIRTMVLKRDLA